MTEHQCFRCPSEEALAEVGINRIKNSKPRDYPILFSLFRKALKDRGATMSQGARAEFDELFGQEVND